MKETEMIKAFIKYEIENNDYYSTIKETMEDYDTQRIYNVFMDYFNGYYSIWTILDTIEDYLMQDKENGTQRTIQEIVDSEDFTIKDRF